MKGAMHQAAFVNLSFADEQPRIMLEHHLQAALCLNPLEKRANDEVDETAGIGLCNLRSWTRTLPG
jgi:hypothetical protein